jgi:copper chaperone CopZ
MQHRIPVVPIFINQQIQFKMKNLKVIATAIVMFAGLSGAYAKTVSETVKVSGNCGMCAKKIEGAAKKAGAEKATWDKKAKVLSITYDDAKTNNDAIQKKVASVGYDTEKYAGDMKAYKSLEECCQYDDKRAQ